MMKQRSEAANATKPGASWPVEPKAFEGQEERRIQDHGIGALLRSSIVPAPADEHGRARRPSPESEQSGETCPDDGRGAENQIVRDRGHDARHVRGVRADGQELSCIKAPATKARIMPRSRSVAPFRARAATVLEISWLLCRA